MAMANFYLTFASKIVYVFIHKEKLKWILMKNINTYLTIQIYPTPSPNLKSYGSLTIYGSRLEWN